MLQKNLSKLVTFKTLSFDHASNQAALEWVRKQLKGLPIYSRTFWHNGFPSLLVTTRKTKSPRVLLQAHIDVVSGSPKIFRPTLKADRLYGRGVFDMKFAIASYIAVFQKLGKNLKNYDFGMLLTSDEEIGGANGVKKFLDSGYSCAVCILPDGGENWTMQRGAKGTLQLLVTSKGVSGHGSRPWTGINAIEQLLNFLLEVQNKFPYEPCSDREHIHNTCNIGSVSGGKESNKIPDYAEAKLDIRHVPETSKRQMLGMLKKIQKKFPGITFSELLSGNAYALPIRNPYILRFQELLEATLKKKIEFIVSHGSSDARYFAEQNIPTILTRPVGAGHHTEKEWISIKSLETFTKVLEEYVTSVGK